MSEWFSIIQRRLGLAWLAPTTDVVPFGITGVPAAEWAAPSVEQVSDTHWILVSRTAAGLEATWHMQFFPDTRALECWGEVTQRGSAIIRGILECLTIDADLQLPNAFGQPLVRTVNGVRFLPNYFPPHDFAVQDRQLLHTPQVYTPLAVHSDEDGRPSGGDLPCAIFCDERSTNGLACFLEWSGLWRIGLKQAPHDFSATHDTTPLRLQIGLRGLQIDLERGQSLPLPRVLLAAFDGGLDAGGNAVRRHIRQHVMPKLGGQEVLPPTSFNHWFAFANNFTDELLKPAVKASAAAGLEYFCVDGGWFRGDFRNGIGNWSEGDPAKFPHGIAPFADFVRSQGLKYGTWFEPEWAHRDSELYQQHPEWFWPSPPTTVWFDSPTGHGFNPNIHLMNFGLAEVREWWLERFVRAYDEWGMRWVRWDYNQMPRPNWDNGVAPGQIGWRQIAHVTGLYQTLDAIMEACPDLLIEQCASGGHRIELGTIRRGHSFWMNDHTTHTDIVRALQHGLNTVLPGNYANTNLCQDRFDFSEYDYLSHGAGGFGYSGKLWEMPKADFERFAAAVQRFKSYRHILLGDYERPTGQPARTTDYARVVFRKGADTVALEFNAGELPGSATISIN